MDLGRVSIGHSGSAIDVRQTPPETRAGAQNRTRMPSRRYPTSLVLALAAGATGLLSSSQTWAVDIKVDPATKYQTMSGWEVTLSGLLEIDISSNSKGAYEPSLNAKL